MNNLYTLVIFIYFSHPSQFPFKVPVIEPKDVPAYKQDPYVTELMSCQNTPSEIVLSLLLKKHDWSELTATKRAHVQAKLAKFFAIPKVSCAKNAWKGLVKVFPCRNSFPWIRCLNANWDPCTSWPWEKEARATRISRPWIVAWDAPVSWFVLYLNE